MDRPESNRVVLIEDDELVATSITSVMESRSLSIETFDSAESFIQAFSDAPNAVLLIDIDLGPHRLSGIELLRWIRSKNWKIPVIILSGKVTVPQAVEAMRESVVDIISKPPSLPRLLGAVEQALLQTTEEDLEHPSSAVKSVLESLSNTERSILELLLAGASNKLIAARMDIGLRSAVRYRKSLLDAFGFKTVAALANALGAAGIGPKKIVPLTSLTDFHHPKDELKRLQDQIVLLSKLLAGSLSADEAELRSRATTVAHELAALAESSAEKSSFTATTASAINHVDLWIFADDPSIAGLLVEVLKFNDLTSVLHTSVAAYNLLPKMASHTFPRFILALESEGIPRHEILDFASQLPADTSLILISQPGGALDTPYQPNVYLLQGPINGSRVVQLVSDLKGGDSTPNRDLQETPS